MLDLFAMLDLVREAGPHSSQRNRDDERKKKKKRKFHPAANRIRVVFAARQSRLVFFPAKKLAS
jgi:hypothetical protein